MGGKCIAVPQVEEYISSLSDGRLLFYIFPELFQYSL